jgi:predicted CXXCH cytochrome family protein
LEIPEELPRDDKGDVTCVTCHNPHGSDSYTHFIRERYAVHFEKKKGTDVHVQDLFVCSSCHVESSAFNITKDSHELRFGGDDIMLCVSCHVRARSHHPVGLPLPEKMSKRLTETGNVVSPDKLGRISCTTCHTNNCDTEDKHMSVYSFTAIPADLTLCWYCHDKETLREANPHESNASELNDRCMFCHDRPPVKGLQKSGGSYFVSSVRLMCLRCHENINPKDLMHVTVYPVEGMLAKMAAISEETNIPFPLANDGRLTCTTCHNAHFSKKDSHRTRLVGESMCTMCHPGGGFTGYENTHK